MKLLLGILFVALGLYILVGTYTPIITEEINYNLAKFEQNTGLKPTEPKSREFGIMIPKIRANAVVVKDVDPFDPIKYQLALSKGVAHSKTSALPSEKGNVFIFSHSSTDFYQATKYNSVFYLLNKLDPGDAIKILYEGKEYMYAVEEKKVVDPAETDYLSSDYAENQLTLMTCWPPGTSLKRLVVTAVKSESLSCPPAPVDYLARSNCPYGSARLDGECRVVCPIFKNNSYSVSCQKDSDCGCSSTDLRSKDLEAECRCAENKCVYPVKKSAVTNWP